jgi:hypothetical protein
MTTEKLIIGWREWVELPELGIPGIKAKVDTGARTSALHTFEIEPFNVAGTPWVRFGIHPLQKDTATVVCCQSPVKDIRTVTDSGGHREKRYVIQTAFSLGGRLWQAEVTLANRDTMRFRMLLGRTALQDGFLIDPGGAYLFGKMRTRSIIHAIKPRKEQ